MAEIGPFTRNQRSLRAARGRATVGAQAANARARAVLKDPSPSLKHIEHSRIRRVARAYVKSQRSGQAAPCSLRGRNAAQSAPQLLYLRGRGAVDTTTIPSLRMAAAEHEHAADGSQASCFR